MTTAVQTPHLVSPWRRLNQTLLPDYNRKAMLYWWSVVGCGLAVVVHSLSTVAAMPPLSWIQILAGLGIAMLAGMFPVRIPMSKNSFAAGEIFIFLLLLLHGPAAATLASTGEALIGSWRTSKRWSSRIASPAMAAVSMWATASLLQYGLDWVNQAQWLAAPALLMLAMAFGVGYFLLNTLLVTLVPKLKRNERLTSAELFGNFGWVGITYAGSASIATLLFLVYEVSGYGVLMAGVPIIGLLLATLHLFFRQQEANEAFHRSQAEAQAREQQQAQRHMEQLRRIAFQDSLTGLPNRRHFHELLERAVSHVRNEPQHEFAVLFLDFDRFKLINDTLGHNAGDEFLVQLSHRLQREMRVGDVVARLGGDEFAVLIEGLQCERYAVALAERLQATLKEPLHLGGTEVNTSASIGITTSAFGYKDANEVLRDADIAMYRSKAAGKARYTLFDVGLRAAVGKRLQLEGDLRRALAQGRMVTVYQPLIHLASNKLVGFEALARWEHPEFGAISPAAFVPIAEESGLVVQLTDAMLHNACRQLRTWQQRHPGCAELTVHVNVSSNDLSHNSLVGRVAAALTQADLQARHLTLELTENILMTRLQSALPILETLGNMGVLISLDDFGTGYSSLSHLSRLPIDILKIDKSVVRDMANDSKARAIVEAIALLGRALGKYVLAEGIEEAQQVELVRNAGCHVGQGFHLARPMTAEQVDAWLAAAAPHTEPVRPPLELR